MSLVPCRFNPAHKCKPGRLEIHEYNCPDRKIAKNSHADYIPKTGYVKKPKVHYDQQIIQNIRNYIPENNGQTEPENINNVKSSYGGRERNIVGLGSKKKKNKGGYNQEKKIIEEMEFIDKNENEEDDEFKPISNDEIISSSNFQNQKEIGEEFEIDTGKPLIGINNNNNKFESNISIGELYDPNEEDRFIEEKNKNWINMKNIKSKLQNRN